MTNFRIIFFKFYFEATFPLKKGGGGGGEEFSFCKVWQVYSCQKHSKNGSLPMSQTGIKIQDK